MTVSQRLYRRFLELGILIGTIAFSAFSNAHGMSEADKQQILDAGPGDFVSLGATHMLSGYDHLLFLLGVVFFLRHFGDIVKFITAFTVGHSITLIFATLYGIQANYYLIDAVIALTVCYKGFENLGGFQRLWHIKSPNLLMMVFVFGLIHGFGLSTRLQQLPMGEGSVVMKILAFNVGVEVGQIAALAVMLLAIAALRKSTAFEPVSRIVNSALVALGALLLIHQLHGYQHTVYSEDFPISRDDHSHAHEEQAKQSLQNYQRRLTLPPEPEPEHQEYAPEPDYQPKPEQGGHRHDDGSYHSHH